MKELSDWAAIIGLSLAVLVNFGVALWWSAKLDSRVSILEDWFKKVAPVLEWIARMETRMTMQQGVLDRIETRLEELRRTVDRHVGDRK